ncbi:hypothetical protein D9Q98_008145 [Chlorella vulgaris]|uniref:JmjC domain-containing protein n=1 Tax=Chlorella vulgaris TaxID=3077 RepID=A0A9D4TG44_CHLVU|nr:hypothetical protein D9Q98_008145 [Chlorella vulgaris]
MTDATAGMIDAPPVNWQHVVAALQAGNEWQQLLADLTAAAGGPCVAVLLRRAAAAAAAGQVAAAHGGADRGGGGGTARLAEAVQQVAWEKLHCGDWHAVPVLWRDTYAAASILAAAAGLPSRDSSAAAALPATQPLSRELSTGGTAGAAAAAAEGGTGATAAAAAEAAAEAAGLGAALWHLDMAAIMGGPLLRPAVDALVDALQRRWQYLHCTAPEPPAQQEAGQQEARQEEEVQEGAETEQQGGAAEASHAAAPPPSRPSKRPKLAAHAHAGTPVTGGSGGGPAEAAAPPNSASQPAAWPPAVVPAAVVLPPWSLGPKGSPVAAAHLPSLEAFWRQYMGPGSPAVISGAMDDWPAMARWADPAYFVHVAGPRTVPVEVGEHFLADQWGQQLMTLQRFVQQHILGAAQGRSAQGGAAGGAHPCVEQQQQQQQRQQQERAEPASEHQEAAEQQQGSAAEYAPPQRAQRVYLAQHPLFDQIPALAADIREPAYCCLGEGEVKSVNAWFGPAGTVTPLHTDPHANLLCQAVGRKYVRLYSPACTAAMYPHPEGMHSNSSQVDAGEPDLQRFPLFGQAPFQDCVLEAGQMLFIPAGWWHYVRSLSVSCSVSFWWH